jgi:hypothetical protein
MAKPYTAKEAQQKLQIDRNKFYRFVKSNVITSITQPGSTHKLYERKSVNLLARQMTQFRNAINEVEEGDEKEQLTFRQATPEDMDGVYEVAHELFGHTTQASQRKLMVAKCPQGNYVVLSDDEIVAYVHILPLHVERLEAFMKGKIRGWDITADDLDCFAIGKPVECLVRSIGATKKYGEGAQHRFARRLLSGIVRELIDMGKAGIEISKLYATSSELQGQRICYSADMKFYSKPLENRLTFVVDVLASDNPTFRRYREALAEFDN